MSSNFNSSTNSILLISPPSGTSMSSNSTTHSATGFTAGNQTVVNISGIEYQPPTPTKAGKNTTTTKTLSPVKEADKTRTSSLRPKCSLCTQKITMSSSTSPAGYVRCYFCKCVTHVECIAKDFTTSYTIKNSLRDTRVDRAPIYYVCHKCHAESATVMTATRDAGSL